MSYTECLNTLYVTQPEAYLAKRDETVLVRQHGETLVQVPLHHLGSIVCLGQAIGVSPELMLACAEAGVSIVFLRESGRFLGRIEGKPSGNVLLRKAQFRLAEAGSPDLARRFIQGKVTNCRTLLLRFAREQDGDANRLSQAADRLSVTLGRLKTVDQIDILRGLEGEAAACYFDAFPNSFKVPGFSFERRLRRPPPDPVNAMLSFLYALLAHDCVSALLAVGLDPQVGFLHVDRPGRPSLALDLMEQFRPVLVDRLVVKLINRRELSPEDFDSDGGQSCLLKPDARKRLIVAYQTMKQETLVHPFLQVKTCYGVLPLLQARLLAKAIRGEMETYVPYLQR